MRQTAAFMLVVGWVCASGAYAQTGIPVIPEAEDLFQEGVSLFEEGSFDEAYERFSRIFVEFQPNSRTTAAMLMAGKSLYAGGAYRRAANLMTRLIEDYPESRYVDAARQTRSRAEVNIERDRRIAENLITVGIALPIDQTQYVRPMVSAGMMAVDRYNRSNPVHPVKLIVIDSGGNGRDAVRATEHLIREDGVDAIIGPLYSEEARGAAVVADRAGVPMLVPMATDASVSERMNTVLQTNPTLEMRGRLMGRYAVQRLRLGRLGIIVQRETDAERYATGFISEVITNGAEIVLEVRLEDTRQWYQLADAIERDTLTYLDAVYAPVTGGNAQDLIRALLDGIDSMDPGIRILGNGEWMNLRNADQAEQHLAVFTGSFETDTTDMRYRAWAADFEQRFEREPGEMAVVGWDVMSFLIEVIRTIDFRNELVDALRESERYRGIGRVIDFKSGNVNQAVPFHTYRNGEPAVVD